MSNVSFPPNLPFEPLMTRDEAAEFMQATLPDQRNNFAQLVLLAALDREKMVEAFRAMSEHEVVHTLQCADDFNDWIRTVHEVAETILCRCVVASAEFAGMIPSLGQLAA